MKLTSTAASVVLLFAMATHLKVLGQSDGDAPEVTTKLGKIRGKRMTYRDKQVDVYLSVPYAKPPLGELRFLKPVPAEPWNEVLVADHQPPACPQYTPSPFPWKDDMPGQEEDCLYLNIFAPAGPGQNRTVMFWIYGGGFFLGSIRLKEHNGTALAGSSDVIVVSVNYRLGALGFLYSGTEDAPGNVGLYDMLLGLKWVRDNIAAFGGNPDSITLFGESAGDLSITLLTTSPLTKGLYKRAILESGSVYSTQDGKETNLNMGQGLAERVGCASDSVTLQDNPHEVVNCLRGVDANRIAFVVGDMNPMKSNTFLPVYGDEITGGNPIEAMKNGDFHDTEILIGNVNDEGSFQLTTRNPSVFGFFGEKNTLINKTYASSQIRSTFSSVADDPDKVVQHYLGDVSDDDLEEIRKQTHTSFGDLGLFCPTVYYAEKFAGQGNNVYYYLLTERPSYTEWAEWMGVVHTLDIPFVFGVPTLYPGYPQEEISLSESIMAYWTTFAKEGNPGGNWPLYSRENPILRVLDFSENSVDQEGPHLDNCNFLRQYFDL